MIRKKKPAGPWKVEALLESGVIVAREFRTHRGAKIVFNRILKSGVWVEYSTTAIDAARRNGAPTEKR
jgi:hypothetical protein